MLLRGSKIAARRGDMVATVIAAFPASVAVHPAAAELPTTVMAAARPLWILKP